LKNNQIYGSWIIRHMHRFQVLLNKYFSLKWQLTTERLLLTDLVLCATSVCSDLSAHCVTIILQHH
jgi:hypothetical protein